MRSLFLAWQDSRSRSWNPIGRLDFDDKKYEFRYTKGAEKAVEDCAFRALESFPDLHKIYESDELFPLFANRVPPRSRPDYKDYLEYLNVPQDADDPMAVLSKSGGQRATDSFEVFPVPERENGRYHIHFFVHGIRHLRKASLKRIEGLKPGEQLLLCADFQNQFDLNALLLRTHDEKREPIDLVGYCPRYLVNEIYNLGVAQSAPIRVEVERLNMPPAPLQLRLLCNLTAEWPPDFEPYKDRAFEPIVVD